jgi:hypothetical protein
MLAAGSLETVEGAAVCGEQHIWRPVRMLTSPLLPSATSNLVVIIKQVIQFVSLSTSSGASEELRAHPQHPHSPSAENRFPLRCASLTRNGGPTKSCNLLCLLPNLSAKDTYASEACRGASSTTAQLARLPGVPR